SAAINGVSGRISVSPSTAASFAIVGPYTADEGVPFAFTITALDKFGNTAVGYTGTVHFTSTDGTATLPVDSSLTNGTGSFTATMNTAGAQSISAVDTTSLTVAGNSNTITLAALAPVPTLTGVTPRSLAIGAGDTTITVSGTRFQSNSVVSWGNTAL